MCGCEAHQSGMAVCTCVCEGHDHRFDGDVIVLRKAIRSLNDRLYSLGQEVANLPQPVEATLEVAERVTTIENHDLNKIIERLDKIEDRLSPPDARGTSDKPRDGITLAPNVWDQYGVQWTCKGIADHGDLIWEALLPDERVAGHERIARVFGADLAAQRGPLTVKSPLAEDQEPLPDDVPDQLLHMGHGVKKESDSVRREPLREGEHPGPRGREKMWEPAEESDDVFLARLGTDAQKWAQEFVRLFSGIQVIQGDAPSDETGFTTGVDESLMITWFANAIGAGESKNGVALDYLRYLAGENYREKATEWFENYYGTPSYRPPGPGGLIEDLGNRIRDLEAASPPAQETFVAAVPVDHYAANADRIRLAKDALVATGYFTEGQVDDEIAPRITELNAALGEKITQSQDAAATWGERVNHWKDRAIIAERRLERLKRIVTDSPLSDEPVA